MSSKDEQIPSVGTEVAEIDAIIAQAVAEMGPAAGPAIRGHVARQTSRGAKIIAARIHADPCGGGAAGRLLPGEIETLASLGFTTLTAVQQALVVAALDDLRRNNVSPARVALLTKHGVTRNDTASGWLADAYLSAPLPQLTAAMEGTRDPMLRYARVVSITDPSRAVRLRQFSRAGCLYRVWVESPHSLRLLQRLRRVVEPRGQNRHGQARMLATVRRLADNGFTDVDVDDFGVALCDATSTTTVDLLRAHKVKVGVIRSLHQRLRWRGDAARGYLMLHDAGINRGREAIVYAEALATSDPKVIAAAAKIVDAPTLRLWADALGRPLLAEEIDALGVLLGRRATTEVLTAYLGRWSAVPGAHPEAPTLTVIARAVEAGVGPERIGLLLRAKAPCEVGGVALGAQAGERLSA